MCNFSVIIPVYNTKKYLKECIGSILKQSNQSFEIILINDGSTDSSDIICNAYKSNSKFRIIHQDNSGPSSARNRGLDIAKGKYIMFMDSDDYLCDENTLSEFNNIFKEEQCDIIYGVYHGFVDANYKTCTYEIYPKELKVTNEETKDLNTDEVVELLFERENYYVSPTIKIYNRNFLERNKFRFKLDIYLEDEEWTPRILLNSSKISFYNKAFYKRRIREGSIVTSTSDDMLLKKIKDMLVIAKEMTKYTEEECKNEKLKTIFKDYYDKFYIGCRNLYNVIENKEIKAKAKEAITESVNVQFDSH